MYFFIIASEIFFPFNVFRATNASLCAILTIFQSS
eukprot:07685.XXX_363629_363733_1 [CDS] Oithona nana genome sequencing.